MRGLDVRVLAGAGAALLACGGPAAPETSTWPGVTSATTVVGESTGAGTGTGTSEAETSASSDTSGGESEAGSSGVARDVGVPEDFGSGQPAGCQGKIDFLFLIARNGTMDSEQAALLASIPGFIAVLQEKFAAFDSHILVANPDGSWGGWACEEGPCLDPDVYPTCGSPNAEDYLCQKFPLLLTPCDQVLGAGLLFNAGGAATNAVCELHGGHRYIVGGEPDLAGAFECIAKVGYSGPDFAFGDAMIAALSPEMNGPQGCNEGFLRKEALLVVVLIADTEDVLSKKKPVDWYKAVIDAKGGDPNAVVVTAILPPILPQEPPPGCPDNNDGDGRLMDFFHMFPQRVQGDVCAPTFADALDATAELVGEACAGFIPQ